MIEPALRDDLLRNDLRKPVHGDRLSLWWLGQSGFFVKTARSTVVFDPYLSDSLTHKYASTDKPHVRMTARCIDPGRLTDVHIITSSHNHTDHLDAETLLPMLDVSPAADFLIPEANREFVAKRLHCDPAWPLALDAGQSLRVQHATVHAVPAAHEQIDRDAEGHCLYLGYVVQLGEWTVYHSGDTVWVPELTEALAPFSIDVAFLPINGRRPERRVAGNMFGDEAARFAHDIGARLVIPCHYDMFAFNTESPELFQRTCARLGQAHRVLRCGERCDLAPGEL